MKLLIFEIYCFVLRFHSDAYAYMQCYTIHVMPLNYSPLLEADQIVDIEACWQYNMRKQYSKI